MPRRRYRLFTVCAVILVFLFYRVLENSWALSNSADSQSSINTPPKAPGQPLTGGSESDVKGAEDIPKKLAPGLLGDEQDIEKTLEADSKSSDKLKQDTSKEDYFKQDTLKESIPKQDIDTPTKDTSKLDTLKEETSKQESSSDYTGKDSPTKEDKEDKESIHKEPPEIPNVHWSDPPTDNHNLDHPTEDKDWTSEHWVKPKENFPLPTGSITPIPTGTPKKIPKIQYEFGTESERTRNKRLHRQGRVKAELERAWSGYRKFAWMHDELSPQSNHFHDPFCGWAATLVDSLDTLWIADMRDEFDEAANAVAKIDFTFTPRSDIPVFETTIRYLGGLIAAYDVSGGPKSKYPILLTKATELAEILMGIFDTPNRMPILYYHWRAPYSSEPHRATVVGIAELATLSMEFTRLAQLTGTDKYYDAIDRITDALIKMQKDGETDIPGLFPEKVDASGCNKTAITNQNNLSREAQNQMDSDEQVTSPPSFGSESGTKKLNARAAIPPPGPEEDKSEDTVTDESWALVDPPLSTEQGEDQTKNQQRAPPFKADGTQAEWDCVPQGLVAAQWGSGMYHVGGSQDSAYEYFSKEYLLLGGLESKYQKLHEDTIDAVNKHLLYRPMIKNSGDWDILFPAKITKTGLKEPRFSISYELAHLTCFVGGMYGLGGKIFNRPDDIELAKQLTDGCVWAYQSTTTGVMPEFAHLAPCPTLDKCKFNQTHWYELLDPSKEWRDNEVAKWEKEEALREQALEAKEKLREQAREKAKASQDEETEYSTNEHGASKDKTSDYKYLEGKSSEYKSKSKDPEYDTSEDKTSADKIYKEKTTEDDSVEDKVSKGRTFKDTLSEDKSSSYRSSDDKTFADKIYDGKTTEDDSVEEKLSKEKTLKDTLSEDKSSGYRSSNDKTSAEKLYEEKTTAYDPVKENVSKDKTYKDTLSEDKASSYSSSDDDTSADKIYKEKTTEYDSVNDKVSKEKTLKDTLSEDESSGYKSSDDVNKDSESELKAKDVASEQKFSHLQKRNGIPMPELDTAMSAPKGESGSELPESLKKKLGMGNRWEDDVSEDTSDSKHIAPPLSETPSQRPATHEEFVERRLANEKLPPGYTNIATRDYILRPEAIESVWYMYRITGDPEWQDKGWTMFEATVKATRTEFANSAIDNVMSTSPGIKDSMESFWTAETLKYYYLLFSEPDLISLDEWVLNTEAHPFRRPTASSSSKASEED